MQCEHKQGNCVSVWNWPVGTWPGWPWSRRRCWRRAATGRHLWRAWRRIVWGPLEDAPLLSPHSSAHKIDSDPASGHTHLLRLVTCLTGKCRQLDTRTWTPQQWILLSKEFFFFFISRIGRDTELHQTTGTKSKIDFHMLWILILRNGFNLNGPSV